MKSKMAIKYLEVIINANLNFREHVEFICKKASVIQGAVTKMMPNIIESNPFQRRLISRVVMLLSNMADCTLLGGNEKETVHFVLPQCD